jgi:hypothetical protein
LASCCSRLDLQEPKSILVWFDLLCFSRVTTVIAQRGGVSCTVVADVTLYRASALWKQIFHC